MPKTMTETNDVKSVAVPSVKPFPPGLARPDQTRDWATSLLSAVAAAGLTRHRDAMMNTSAEAREAPIAQAVMMFPRKDPKTALETESRYIGSGGVLDGGMTVTPDRS